MAEEIDELKGYQIVFGDGPAGPELLVGNSPVPIRKMPGGGLILDQDAYNLVSSEADALARQFLLSRALAQYREEHESDRPGKRATSGQA